MNVNILKQAWFEPAFAAILARRTESITLVAAGALQTGLHLAGLPGWACPFKQVFGIPCPGCGLTTATGQLLHGQFAESLETHLFAPVFLGAFVLMAVALLLPKPGYHAVVGWIAALESRTGMTAWILIGLLGYWIVRLMGLV